MMSTSSSLLILYVLSGALCAQNCVENAPIGRPGTQNGECAGLATFTSAKESTAPGEEGLGFIFRAKVEEVSLHATVTDKKNKLVTDLDRNSFRVFEDDKPQVITSFGQEDVPVALGIVVDNSGSMLDKRDRVNRAALKLIQASNKNDQVFVVNFNDQYYIDQDFTSDVERLEQALTKMQTAGGTALYDALIAAAEHLKLSDLQKKILVVVTDGEDDESHYSFQRTVEILEQRNGPIVYAIGILTGADAKPARRVLETIAEKTGGVAFIPKTVNAVEKISAMVARDIRTQYTLDYKPSTPPSGGGYRHIRVEVQALSHKGLNVRTRAGYYAGQ